MTVTKVVIAVVTFLGLLAFVLFRGAPQEQQQLFNSTAAQQYELHYQQKIFDFSLDDFPTPSFVFLEADLQMQVKQQHTDTVIVLFQLSDINLTLVPENRRLSRALQDYYSRVVKVRFSSEGKIIAMEFPGLEKNFVGYRQMLQQLEMIIKKKPYYTLQQEDALGTYEAKYRANALEVSRHKTAYKSVQNGAKIIIYKSLTEATFTKERSWYETFRLQEKLRLSNKGKKILQVETKIDLKSLEDNVDDLEMDTETFFRLQEEDHDLYQKVEDENLENYFKQEKLDLDALLARIFKDPSNLIAYSQLQTYLRLHPEKISALYEVINRVEDGVARDLIAVLDDLQLPESQRLMARMAQDVEVKEMNRIRSVIALGAQKHITEEAVTALEILQLEREGEAARDLSNTALLSLGALSESSLEIQEGVKSALRDAEDYETARIALLSAKNGGVKPYLSEIMPYLENSNRKLRLLSVTLLESFAHEPEVEDALKNAYEQENDTKVKAHLEKIIKEEEFN